MAVEPRKISGLPVANNASANDLMVIVKNAGANSANTYQITVENYQASFANANTSYNLVKINYNVTPANSNALTIPRGYFWTDGNYIYTSSANNVVKRAALSTF